MKQMMQDIKASHLPVPNMCWLSAVIKGDAVEDCQLQSGVFKKWKLLFGWFLVCVFGFFPLKAVITGQATWPCLNRFSARN